MKRLPLAAVIPLVVLFSACTSFKADMVTICDSERISQVERDPKLDTQEKKDAVVAEWIRKNTWTDDAKALMADAWPLPYKERAAKLKEGAKKAGLEHCALADALDRRAAVP